MTEALSQNARSTAPEFAADLPDGCRVDAAVELLVNPLVAFDAKIALQVAANAGPAYRRKEVHLSTRRAPGAVAKLEVATAQSFSDVQR